MLLPRILMRYAPKVLNVRGVRVSHLRLLLLASLLLLTACGGGGGGGASNPAPSSGTTNPPVTNTPEPERRA